MYDDLSALFINCSLKPSDRPSNTAGLMSVSRAIMEKQGVRVEEVRAASLNLAPGVQPDMREDGFPHDEWPALSEKVMAADILVIGTPIWLGAVSSVCARVLERLYAHSGELNAKGQSIFYGKTGGCVITGNEDGIKHCARDILFCLQHLGYTIPPQADAGWIGEAGPGPSYCDDGSGGPQNAFTQQNTTIMSWNLMHAARMLKDAGGWPRQGNDRKAWEAGERFGHPDA